MASAGIKSTPIILFNAKGDFSLGCDYHTGKTGNLPSPFSVCLGDRTKQAKSCHSISNWKPHCSDFCSHGIRLHCLSKSRELTALILVRSPDTVRDSQLWVKPSRSEGSSLASALFTLNGYKREHSVLHKATADSFAITRPGKSYDQEIVSHIYSQRRAVTITVAATADSGQTFPSQNEGEETAMDCARGDERAIPRTPNPEIEPADVIQAQLQALRGKDLNTVFEFASPKNKAHTGPLPRFAEMIRGRAYNVMLGHVEADILSSLSICPKRFQQRILIKGANGNQAVFSWSLSKQENGPFEGCWMTDSVHRDT